ncbi:MAG TPA: RNA-binding S4 domain-containing protein [Phenylobacterium sp.]|nr:RNA-binding S4 domain-containing protein [Phenylobacterium sp.]
MSEAAGSVRVDVWLWRARFFKTRSLAAKFLDEGKVRLTRAGAETRIDKCARPVKVGDQLVFALGGRLTAVVVEALGERRGPPEEARRLYTPVTAA